MLEQLGSEIGNLRTAWRFWVDQADLEELFDLIDGLWALHEAKGWYHAAIELATDTLGVLAKAESSPKHAAEELILRTSLARALMAVRGYGVEVEEAFKRALEIAETTGAGAHSFPVLRALATYYMNIADFEKGAALGGRLLELGEKEGDEAIRIEGHYVLGAATAFAGDLDSGLPHLDRAIELHDSRSHNSTRFRLGPSTGVVARVASGLILWQCGELNQAVTRLKESLVIARALDHPYSIAFALYHNGFLANWRNHFDECLEYARELGTVASENDYLVWKTLATVLEGVALTSLGETEGGLALTETGIELYEGLTTPPIFWPLILTLRATVHAMAGKPEQALELINEAIRLGAPEELVSPDFRIFKGDFLRMLPEPDLAAAEDAYQAAIRGSRAGKLALIELHALTRLVGLRREMGQASDGSDELAALYATFTEGFDEDMLITARTMLGA